MLRFLLNTDALASQLRPAFMWLGQIGVVALGTHLAADRVDDYASQMLAASPIPWADPQLAQDAGTWVAIGLELVVVVWAVWTLVHARADSLERVGDWWKRSSVHAALAASAWLPLGIAGAWVVGMAVEDAVAQLFPSWAVLAGLLVALVVAWRLTFTGWWRVVVRTPPAKRAIEGWPWLVPVGLVALLALRFGLPVWGWL
ncbi:MAG: hypothetical protein KTR31_08640 [Myxococcales bacterium]|nr:hypothetical protein [Myxococcales bacterium]